MSAIIKELIKFLKGRNKKEAIKIEIHINSNYEVKKIKED